MQPWLIALSGRAGDDGLDQEVKGVLLRVSGVSGRGTH